MQTLLIVLLLSAAAWGQSAQYSQDFETFWKPLTPDTRFSYVAGYTSGATITQTEAITTCGALWMFSKPISATYTKEQWQTICFPSPAFNGSITQYRDGVDVFYSDFRNRKINFDSAMQHVRDQISGKPQADLEASLEHLRKCAVDSEHCFAPKK